MTFTFVAMTYNLWSEFYLDQRRDAIASLFTTRPPDLLAVQELRPATRKLLDDVLPDHDRIDGTAGWETQSNLWWRRDLFTYVEHGAEDVGILSPDAHLFWVRLRTPDDTELIFSTAHLTWPGHSDERTDHVNRRIAQARAIGEALERLAGDGACLFTVDINDIGPPQWELGNAGFLDSFTALGRHSPVTHPVVPTVATGPIRTRLSPLASPPKAIDWIFARGPLAARSSEVVDFFHDGRAPSDHYPVVATYTL
ncbi:MULTISPECIES: endonuclease/exonuclease/phosphatase family protein [Kribbella]|uniref:Endonuclease/exonuclease/phosphatase family metal-dependent hydrolase n=1 Tax=Kribbella pratensis TaxID=2512112 RepID=A0ABY2FQN0_9ACTN|nr:MULTISPECIES: endonuclease/exonuclease/phosphatase family protein [Kribbella]TDW95243.1 endonuclease/exonuclease/phosphatase family metal-dependent hydrolase [Kribbella pratensis]TDX03855.1 endonuclease/exonuclease/phosphatase family metal-dependent hydrolase [Kribbella sp. VKM Ac-2566]